MRFVCPSWTVEELERGYGDKLSVGETESLFKQCGGSPRLVVSLCTDCSLTQQKLLLRGDFSLLSEKAVTAADWPCSLLRAQYSTDETAATPRTGLREVRREERSVGLRQPRFPRYGDERVRSADGREKEGL